MAAKAFVLIETAVGTNREVVAALTKVKIGQRQQGRVEVVSGLSPDDLVVTDGQIKLNDGVSVMVLDGRMGMAGQ